jgi:hypothetical protein
MISNESKNIIALLERQIELKKTLERLEDENKKRKALLIEQQKEIMSLLENAYNDNGESEENSLKVRPCYSLNNRAISLIVWRQGKQEPELGSSYSWVPNSTWLSVPDVWK